MNSTIVLDRTAAKQRSRPHLGRTPRQPDTESRYFDTHLNCTVTATTPTADPVSWTRFMTGARASYRKYGVEAALEFDTVIGGESTSLFFLARDSHGTAVGGFRIQGPYASPRDTHADIEWADSPAGRAALADMVADRLPYGVVEMKSVWMAPGAVPSAEPGYIGALGAVLGAVALDCRFTLATSAEHSAGPYVRSGGVVARHIDAVPYPDDRYRTRALWWDRETLAENSDPAIHELICAATAAMYPHSDSAEEKAFAS